tara:strand:+ start:147 stop:503 length:357 start_codon:yes stop_codon:yes gene_type:complete
MRDGHVNKCKTCNLIDAKEHRLCNLEKIREYDRNRGNRQDSEYLQEYRARFPNKYKAHGIVTRAKIAKKLFPEPCVNCGTEENIVAHHCDYLQPLNVVWMCQAHHQQWHAKNGEGLNG